MAERYLVTGGAGFIGSNLVERLLQQGHNVRVLDDFSSGKKDNLKAWLNEIECVEGDIRNADTLRRAVQNVDVVLHQAALGSVPRSLEDPLSTNEVNVSGTLNVLLAAREVGVNKLVFASSSSIYGPTEVSPKRESLPPFAISPYALSKYAGERYCQLFFELYGLPTVCLRYFNVFGPRQDPDSPYAAVIPLVVDALLSGKAPVVFGDGEQTRDFTFVDNAVEANLLAAHAPEEANGHTFNVACGQSLSINALCQTLAKLVGVDVQPLYKPARAGDVPHSLADISQARSLLGYEPHVGVREGLEKTLAWYRAQRA